MPDALARLREAGVPEPGWHLRRIEREGLDVADAVERVIRGEPLHRILGWREFHGLRLRLGSETLEPRDDTEALVALVVRHLPPASRIVDLGAGTGAVGLACLAERPKLRCVFTDISAGALAVAEGNARAHGLHDRATFLHGSWLEPLDGTFDAIVSNPPYIASKVVDALDPSVRDHDPRRALDGGTDGLDAYRAILSGAAAHLGPDGFVALEIGFDQRDAVAGVAHEHGWREFDSERDLGGHVRALAFRPIAFHMERDTG